MREERNSTSRTSNTVLHSLLKVHVAFFIPHRQVVKLGIAWSPYCLIMLSLNWRPYPLALLDGRNHWPLLAHNFD